MQSLRHLISLGAKQRVHALLCHPVMGNLLGVLFRDRIPHRGLRVDTSSKRVSPRTKAKIFWRTYEGAEIRMVLRHLRTDLDVIELGASLGVMSSHLRRLMDPEAKLIVVEADPELARIAGENIARNSTVPAYSINAAVEYEGSLGEVEFVQGTTSESGHKGTGVDGEFKVPTISLGEITAQFGLQEYVLVADIEGSESGLISDDSRSLRSCKQLVIELHDSEFCNQRFSPEILLESLVGLGFRVREREGRVCLLEQ